MYDDPWEWEGNRYFILVGKVAVPSNIEGWSKWFEENCDSNARIVAFTKTDEVEVSTVFLGLNHNFNFEPDRAAPLLFETMAFHKLKEPYRLINGREVEWSGEETMRCSTWDEAELQHRIMVAEVISKEYLGTPEQLKAIVEEIFKGQNRSSGSSDGEGQSKGWGWDK
jgi:hypothetical protein